jgi:hypothetical protein
VPSAVETHLNSAALDYAPEKQLRKPRNCKGASINLQKNSVFHSIAMGKRLRTFLNLVRGTSRSFLSENSSAGVGGTYASAQREYADSRDRCLARLDVTPGCGARGSARHGRPAERTGAVLGSWRRRILQQRRWDLSVAARRAWRENGGENYTRPWHPG